jgi:hypothetical protein
MNFIPTSFAQFARKLLAWLLATLAVGTLLRHQNTLAQECNPGFGAGIGVMTPTGATVIYNGAPTLVAHIGDTITINSVAVFTSAFGSTCGVTNGHMWVVYPNNTYQKVFSDFTLLSSASGGSGHQCPSADAVCLPYTQTYLVNAADLNRPLSFTTNNGTEGITIEASPQFFEIQFGFVALGVSVGGAGSFSASDTLPVLIITDSISITEECVTNCPPNGSAAFGDPIRFQGRVTNTSDTNTVLDHISLSSSPSATIAFSTTTTLGHPFDPILGNLNNQLVPGDSVDYAGSYTPAGSGAALRGPFSDSITVTAQDVTGLTISNSASATCTVCMQSPSFTSIGFNPDHSFGLQFTADTNVAYQVLVSTNLRDWQTLGFATQVAAGAYQLTDAGATNHNQAFYRVVLP